VPLPHTRMLQRARRGAPAPHPGLAISASPCGARSSHAVSFPGFMKVQSQKRWSNQSQSDSK
jgi:hypothetical protein